MHDKKMPEMVCGNCRFNKHDTQDFYCSNEDSDFFTCHTHYGDTCELHEEVENG